jgi:hypothetical protein
VHRRYYRRVIECRDGLVRISPYLARYRIDPGADASTLASRLKDALRAHAEGEPVPPQAMPVAIPQGDGLDADVHELVALARALRGVRRDRGSSALRDTAPAP